jgi:hypothetical protein
MVLIENRRGDRIRDLDEWAQLAAPASYKHWKPFRSAYELARAWISGEAPAVVRRALDGNPNLTGFDAQRAIAEAQTRFDGYGGPRNHDLLIYGRAAAGPVIVSVEGKADETFGETLARYARAANAKRARGEGTNAPERLAQLVSALTGARLAERPDLAPLRYQLFSATAGALAAAADSGARHAVLLVHEFITPLTSEEKRAQNDTDLRGFLEAVLHAVPPTAGTWCIGPFHVPGSDRIPPAVQLYVAKATTTIAGDAEGAMT